MEPKFCPEESRIIEAARTGQLAGELARHVERCGDCALALEISQLLTEAGSAALEVPPWGLVYWKAELQARRERAERALRPMQTMQIAAVATMAVVAIAAGIVSGVAWVPAAVGAFSALLPVVMWVVRRSLLRDS